MNIWPRKHYTPNLIFSKWLQAVSEWRHFHNQRQQGYFLVETMIAFFILSLLLATVVPIWILIHEKSEAYQHKTIAITLAQNEIELFNHHLENLLVKEVVTNEHTFQVVWLLKDIGIVQEGRLVITWESADKEEEQITFLVYRIREESP